MKQHIHYIALVGLTNDKTGKQFKVGAIVKPGDFPQGILDHWVETCRILRVDQEGKEHDSRQE